MRSSGHPWLFDLALEIRTVKIIRAACAVSPVCLWQASSSLAAQMVLCPYSASSFSTHGVNDDRQMHCPQGTGCRL